MAVSPVGTLTFRKDRKSGTVKHELSRRVQAFPSVGDQVLMPTSEQVAAIVDLSLVPSDVVHVVVGVMARFVFEAQQRYRHLRPDGKALSTVLVLEEAHNFVRRGSEDEGTAMSPSNVMPRGFRTDRP